MQTVTVFAWPGQAVSVSVSPNNRAPWWGPARTGWERTAGDTSPFGKFQPSCTGGHHESLPLRAEV